MSATFPPNAANVHDRRGDAGAGAKRGRRASDAPRRAPGVLGLYLAFWHYAAGKRHLVVLSSVLLVASQLIKLAIPWLAAQAIDAIQRQGADGLATAGTRILGIIGVAMLSWALHGPGRVIERNVGVHVRQRLADGLYAKLGRMPLAWHEMNHTGETLHRMNKTTYALSDFAQNQFIYLQNIVNLIGPIVALAAISAPVGVLAVVGYILVAAVIIRFDRALMRLINVELAADRRYNSALIDFLGNVQSVLALRLQRATRALLRQRIDEVMKPLRKSILVVEYKWACVDLLSISLTWGLVATYALTSATSGGAAGAAETALRLGAVFMVYQYAGQAAGVIGSLATNFQAFARYQADYASADSISRAPDATSDGGPIPADWKEIRVEALSFSHPRSNDERAGGLHDVAITLRRGEKLALIGPSGAGKSTLMRALAGLYMPGHARFSVDGQPSMDLRHLSRIATFIPQDAEVFEATVRDNVTFGERFSDNKLAQFARVSAFDAVLATMPQGWETPIVERGSNLSGGQKQRLALTRGLLAASDSTLVMLDEPTSALDAVTESQVFSGLRAAFPDATVIASVHRLAVLPHFDRVVLMQAGRVVDVGTIDELTERQALFRDLWQGGRTGQGRRASDRAPAAPRAVDAVDLSPDEMADLLADRGRAGEPRT